MKKQILKKEVFIDYNDDFGGEDTELYYNSYIKTYDENGVEITDSNSFKQETKKVFNFLDLIIEEEVLSSEGETAIKRYQYDNNLVIKTEVFKIDTNSKSEVLLEYEIYKYANNQLILTELYLVKNGEGILIEKIEYTFKENIKIVERFINRGHSKALPNWYGYTIDDLKNAEIVSYYKDEIESYRGFPEKIRTTFWGENEKANIRYYINEFNEYDNIEFIIEYEMTKENTISKKTLKKFYYH